MESILSVKNNYWKNGTQWIGRMCAKAMGEDNYERFRIGMRWHMDSQHIAQ